MVQKVFTPEVYKKMVEEILSYRDGIDDFDPQNSYSIDVETEDYYIEFEVTFDYEVHDDTFDHAFGTWYDPCPYPEPTHINTISNVEVHRDDEKVEHDFNEKDFWGYYQFPEYGELKAGDTIRFMICSDWYEGKFVSFNVKNGAYKVLVDGKEREIYGNIQKVS